MSDELPSSIRILPSAVANKIAAGEVIERPASVLRELLDNAIDAGAGKIHVSLEEGGIKRLCVSDDGGGMSPQDLRLCYLPHSTSKLRQIEDLQQLHTLGFRGEALSSIAACSQLSITSMQPGAEHGWQLQLEGQGPPQLRGVSRSPGTSVEVGELFFYLPARRHFLKRSSTEAQHCRLTLWDKALGFPHLEFHLSIDGRVQLYLPSEDRLQRAIRLYPELGHTVLYPRELQVEGLRLSVLAAPPQFQRRDRRLIQIYVNHRRVDDEKLAKAVRLGYEGYLPGAWFPACFVFIEIDPGQIDFNIHPAKREVRFLNLATIETLLRRLLRQLWAQETSAAGHILPAELLGQRLLSASPLRPQSASSANMGDNPTTPELLSRGSFSAPVSSQRGEGDASMHQPPLSASLLRQPTRSWGKKGPSPEILAAGLSLYADHDAAGHGSADYDGSDHGTADQGAPDQGAASTAPLQALPFRYLGQLMELFLLFEYRQTLYLVDQHAAHERLLYQQMVDQGLPSEPLLIPQHLEVEADQQQSLHQRAPLLRRLGIYLTADEQGQWQVTALPPQWRQLDAELEQLIVNSAADQEDLQRQLFARFSCRAAIKAGEKLEPLAAISLIAEILARELLHCPHGRPLAISFSREKLESLIGRE